MQNKVTVEDSKYVFMAILALLTTFIAGKIFPKKPFASAMLLILALWAELYILVGKASEFRELQSDLDEGLRLLHKGLTQLDEGADGIMGSEERLPFAKEEARRLKRKNRDQEYLSDYIKEKLS